MKRLLLIVSLTLEGYSLMCVQLDIDELDECSYEQELVDILLGPLETRDS